MQRYLIIRGNRSRHAIETIRSLTYFVFLLLQRCVFSKNLYWVTLPIVHLFIKPK